MKKLFILFLTLVLFSSCEASFHIGKVTKKENTYSVDQIENEYIKKNYEGYGKYDVLIVEDNDFGNEKEHTRKYYWILSDNEALIISFKSKDGTNWLFDNTYESKKLSDSSYKTVSTFSNGHVLSSTVIKNKKD